MSEGGYCKMFVGMIIKKHRATGEHKFKIAPGDYKLFLKHGLINGVYSALVDHPEIVLVADKNIVQRRFHVARFNQPKT